MSERLGHHLAAFLGGGHELGALVARATAALSEGHSCLPLRVACARDDSAEEVLPTLERAREVLAASDAVHVASEGDLATPARRPLVLDAEDRLYLARFYEHERRLATGLAKLAVSRRQVSTDVTSFVRRYFPPGSDDGQRRAAEACLEGGLTLVTGGPGTGKTSTVVRIVAVLVELARSSNVAPPRALLLAPTGKAAARVAEAVRGAKARLVATGVLPVDVAGAIPDEAKTVHRALGVRRDGGFWHQAENRLPYDVVIVDEASMVDLALMRHLVDALADRATLVLLGDRDQLASVEAGSVLSELSGHAARSAEQGRRVAVVAPLVTSYRFDEESGIGRLGRLLTAGDGEGAVELLGAASGTSAPDLVFVDSTRPLAEPALRQRVVERYGAALRAGDATRALAELHGFRVLTAHRGGPSGVTALNEAIVDWLVEARVLASASALTQGRIVLVTKNDPARGLSNGDVGLVWPSASGERLAVHFERPGAPPREISPADLPEHEPAFALTVHKSQGSEFGEVAIVLPPPTSLLLTRELLYTAVTRARERALLVGPKDAVRIAAGRSVVRYSGLGARLFEAERALGAGEAARPDSKKGSRGRASAKRGSAP